MANVVSQASAAMCYKPYLSGYGTLMVVCCGICQASAAVARPKCSVRDWQCSLQNVLFHAGCVFTSGVWPLLSNLEDPELRRSKASPGTTSNGAKQQGGQHHKEVSRCLPAMEDMG